MSTFESNYRTQPAKALLAAAANSCLHVPSPSGMVPRLCRHRWRSGGPKARIPGEVFYCPCSRCEVCRPGHTALSTAATWAKTRRVAAAPSCHRRPPFLKHCLSLRAWFTPTTCGGLRTCALEDARGTARSLVGRYCGFMLPSSPLVTAED